MKITKEELSQMIRENMALRMTQDRMRGRSGSYSEPRANKAAQKRKGNEPITRNNVVKGSFEGTSSDRMKLVRELEPQIEKMIAAGKEEQIPSNWRDVLSLADGDQLLALKNAINPGIFKKVGRFLGLSEESSMQFTKSDLRRIIREELTSLKEEKQFNEEVRHAFYEAVLLRHPAQLLAEGCITRAAYRRAKRMTALNESGSRDIALEEGFFDDVKALASKGLEKAKEKGAEVAAAASEKGKELGGKALEKAKEIGNKEIDVKGASKEMKRVGKEAGELAAGAGEAMLNFIGPMAKKLGAKAEKFAEKTLKKIDKQGPKALAAVSKHIDALASAGMKKAGSGVKGMADLLVKVKDGLTYEQMANKEPEAFMSMYKALEKKVLGMKLRGVKTPEETKATLGIFQSPDGQKALAAAAKKTGLSAAELETLMGLYVFQSRYVPMATKAMAAKG